jgi:hypothetical protein
VTTPGEITAPAPAGQEPATSIGNGTPAGSAAPTQPADAPGGGRDGAATSSLGYSLLSPPDYGNIVGGVAPSPFVSLILLLGVVVMIAAAIAPALGIDSSDWWMVSVLLLGAAVFLAGFVSRSA